MKPGQHVAEMIPVLETLKAAGWITGYSLITDPWVVDWTAHGKIRAAEFLRIAGELDINTGCWDCLEVICQFLPPPPLKEGEHLRLN